MTRKRAICMDAESRDIKRNVDGSFHRDTRARSRARGTARGLQFSKRRIGFDKAWSYIRSTLPLILSATSDPQRKARKGESGSQQSASSGIRDRAESPPTVSATGIFAVVAGDFRQLAP
jgi:hypothetical protein